MYGLEERGEMEVVVGGGGEGGGGDFENKDGEGSERRRGVWREESSGERFDGGFAHVFKALENCHLVDEFVDVGNVVDGGEADAGEECVSGRSGIRECDSGGGRRRGWCCCSCHFVSQVLRDFFTGISIWE